MLHKNFSHQKTTAKFGLLPAVSSDVGGEELQNRREIWEGQQ
jgi:hypothetical protein